MIKRHLHRIFLLELDVGSDVGRFGVKYYSKLLENNVKSIPSIEEQITYGGFQYLIKPELVDNHYIVRDYSGLKEIKAVTHSLAEAIDKSYQIAKEQALVFQNNFGEKYIFIDLTSKGDNEKAKELSKIIDEEIIPSEKLWTPHLLKYFNPDPSFYE